jgi:hypothetical protein
MDTATRILGTPGEKEILARRRKAFKEAMYPATSLDGSPSLSTCSKCRCKKLHFKDCSLYRCSVLTLAGIIVSYVVVARVSIQAPAASTTPRTYDFMRSGCSSDELGTWLLPILAPNTTIRSKARGAAAPTLVAQSGCEVDRGAALTCLAGDHILFVGDSHSRFRYMNLVQLLQHGWLTTPVELDPSEVGPNQGRDVWDNQTWTFWFNETSRRVMDKCDCYRPDIDPQLKQQNIGRLSASTLERANLKQSMENRYWFGPRGTRVSFVRHYPGDGFAVHGHNLSWLNVSCFEEAAFASDPVVAAVACWSSHTGCAPGTCHEKPHWKFGSLSNAYSHMLSGIVHMLRPTVVVAGVYAWSNNWPSSSVIDAFRNVNATAPFVRRIVWAGGTPQLGTLQNNTGSGSDSVAQVVRAAGFDALDFFQLFQPFRAMPKSSSKLLFTRDKSHFIPSGYAAMNHALLRLICDCPDGRSRQGAPGPRCPVEQLTRILGAQFDQL